MITDEKQIEQLDQILHLADPTQEDILQFIKLAQGVVIDATNLERIFLLFSDTVYWYDEFDLLYPQLELVEANLFISGFISCIPLRYINAKGCLQHFLLQIIETDERWDVFPKHFIRSEDYVQRIILELLHQIMDKPLRYFMRSETDLINMVEERIHHIKQLYATHQQPRLL